VTSSACIDENLTLGHRRLANQQAVSLPRRSFTRDEALVA
jgi:hypothetical protein